MPLSTISNGASSATARANINAIVDQLNNSPSLPLTGGTLTGTLTTNVASGDIYAGQLSGVEKFKVTSAGSITCFEGTGTSDLGLNFKGATFTNGFYGNSSTLRVVCNGQTSAYFAANQMGVNSNSGQIFLGVSADLLLTRSAAATLQLGVNAASGVNQTIKACNGTAGAGGNLTLAGGTGTTTNGAVIVTTALLGTSSGGTQPAFGAAINPDFGIYFESQRLMFREGNNAIGGIGDLSSGVGMIMSNGRAYGWSGSSPDGTYDLQLNRTAAANIGLGAPLASGWISQTIAASGGRIGTDTNNSPTNTLTIAGSVSTGTGTGGNLRLGVYGTNGTSGSAIGTLNTVLTVVAARKVINLAGIPTSSAGLSSGDVYSNAGILTIVP